MNDLKKTTRSTDYTTSHHNPTHSYLLPMNVCHLCSLLLSNDLGLFPLFAVLEDSLLGTFDDLHASLVVNFAFTLTDGRLCTRFDLPK